MNASRYACANEVSKQMGNHQSHRSNRQVKSSQLYLCSLLQTELSQQCLNTLTHTDTHPNTPHTYTHPNTHRHTHKHEHTHKPSHTEWSLFWVDCIMASILCYILGTVLTLSLYLIVGNRLFFFQPNLYYQKIGQVTDVVLMSFILELSPDSAGMATRDISEGDKMNELKCAVTNSSYIFFD